MTSATAQVAASEQRGLDVARHLSDMSTEELLALWSSSMGELYGRGMIRSFNNPVADYAEGLVAKLLGLTLAASSTSGYDAIGPDGLRYQIKARRLVSPNASRQLGMLRRLDQDPFDYLIVVLFRPNFELQEIWKIPIDLVRKHASYRAHTNAHVLHARGAVLSDPRAVRLDDVILHGYDTAVGNR